MTYQGGPGHIADEVLNFEDIFLNMLCDSTPMFWHDWFVLAYDVFSHDHLCKCFDLMIDLFVASHATEQDLPVNVLNDFWDADKWIHTGIPTALGSRRVSIAHKIHCLIHAFIIEFQQWLTVKRLCARVGFMVIDIGVWNLVAGTPADIEGNSCC